MPQALQLAFWLSSVARCLFPFLRVGVPVKKQRNKHMFFVSMASKLRLTLCVAYVFSIAAQPL